MNTRPFGVSLQIAVCRLEELSNYRIVSPTQLILLLDDQAIIRLTTILTMLLTVWNIIWPITGVDGIVVEEREWTLLDCGSSVPTMPVTSARGSVWEDSVLPGTVFRGDRLFCDQILVAVVSLLTLAISLLLYIFQYLKEKSTYVQ